MGIAERCPMMQDGSSLGKSLGEVGPRSIHGGWIILVLGIAHALDHSFLAALPPILLLTVRDVGSTLQTMSLIATVAYLLFGLGALVGGPIADRVGEGKVLFVCLTSAGISSFIPFLDRELSGLAVGLALMAAATSLYHPTANSLISKRYQNGMGQAMAIHGVGGSVGQVFIPSISVLLAMTMGWRFSFAFFGALSILVAVFFLKVQSTPRPRSPIAYSRSEIFQKRNFWMVFLYNVFVGLYFRGTELFVPTFLTIQRSFTIETAGLGVSLLMAFGVIGQVIGGIGADRLGAREALILESLGVTSAFILLLSNSNYSAIGFLILYGVSHYATQPTTNALTASICSGDQRGLVYGIMFFLTFGLGSVSSAMAGYLSDGPGMDWAFFALMVMSAIALLFSLFIRGKGRAEPKGGPGQARHLSIACRLKTTYTPSRKSRLDAANSNTSCIQAPNEFRRVGSIPLN